MTADNVANYLFTGVGDAFGRFGHHSGAHHPYYDYKVESSADGTRSLICHYETVAVFNGVTVEWVKKGYCREQSPALYKAVADRLAAGWHTPTITIK